MSGELSHTTEVSGYTTECEMLRTSNDFGDFPLTPASPVPTNQYFQSSISSENCNYNYPPTPTYNSILSYASPPLNFYETPQLPSPGPWIHLNSPSSDSSCSFDFSIPPPPLSCSATCNCWNNPNTYDPSYPFQYSAPFLPTEGSQIQVPQPLSSSVESHFLPLSPDPTNVPNMDLFESETESEFDDLSNDRLSEVTTLSETESEFDDLSNDRLPEVPSLSETQLLVIPECPAALPISELLKQSRARGKSDSPSEPSILPSVEQQPCKSLPPFYECHVLISEALFSLASLEDMMESASWDQPSYESDTDLSERRIAEESLR